MIGRRYSSAAAVAILISASAPLIHASSDWPRVTSDDLASAPVEHFVGAKSPAENGQKSSCRQVGGGMKHNMDSIDRGGDGGGGGGGGSHQDEWPEVVGMSGEVARTQILKGDPKLNVFVLPKTSMVTMDYRLDRVRVFVDEEGRVDMAPKKG
jgi:hypothetical protein